MAGTEQETSVSTGGDDWLSEAIGTEVTAAEPVASDPQPQGEVMDAPVESAEPVEASPVETGSRQRDEHGRFKPKESAPVETKATEQPKREVPVEAAPAEAPKADPKEDREGWIPSWRAREISEAKKAAAERAERAEAEAKAHAAKWEQAQRESAELKRRLDELTKPKQEPVNLFENPEGFVGSVEERLARERDTFQGELRKMRLENNLAISAVVHKEDFPPAYEAFVKAVEAGDKATATRVFNSADPGGAIVAWHRERKALTEIGPDPTAYVQKKLEEALNDPAFLARALEAAKARASGGQPQVTTPAQQARPNNIVKRPPSLSGVPGGQSAHAGGSGASGDWLNEALSR